MYKSDKVVLKSTGQRVYEIPRNPQARPLPQGYSYVLIPYTAIEMYQANRYFNHSLINKTKQAHIQLIHRTKLEYSHE